MPTLTLTPTGGTFLSHDAPTADYSSNNNLYTNQYFVEQTSGGVVNFNPRCAILRFTKSNTLKYKKITSVKFHFEMVLGDGYPSGGVGRATYYFAPYKSDAALSSINYANYQDQGEIGQWIQALDYISGPNPTTTIDITSLFASNLVNDVFNIALCYGGWFSGINKLSYNNYVIKANCYLTVDYETVTQLAPTPLYPKDITLLEAQSMLFSWQFNSETEAVQAGVQLEYKKSTDANYTVLSLTTTDHSYTVNAAFGPGAYQWRLKATNDIAETSGYSDVVSFNVIGKPAAPIISAPENKTITTIAWTAADQYACEIKLLDANQKELVHDTLASSESFYKPNMFLKGNYSFAVRIKNASDIWSDWAQIAFAITAAGPSAATMVGIPENEHAKLEFAIPEGMSAALIRYDDKGAMKVLGLVSGTVSYIDDTICPGKEYAYTVRTYVNGYTDSTLKRITVHYSGAYIKAGDESLHLDLSEEEFLPHSEEISREIAILKFSGREFPMTERGEFTSVTITKRFFVPFEDKEKLDRMAKANSIYYRDSRGNAFKAAITGVSYTEYMHDGYIANITMIRTAEDEVIVNV